MGLTINQIRRLRLLGYRNARRGLRTVDSKVELIQRTLNRIINRRDKIPDQADLDLISDQVMSLRREFTAWEKYAAEQINAGYI